MPAPKNVKAATPAVPAKKALEPVDAEKTAKKASEEARKIEAEAQEKAAKINSNLIKEGSARRIVGRVRDGKPKYFWSNEPVPTQELTDDELKAVEGMK